MDSRPILPKFWPITIKLYRCLCRYVWTRHELNVRVKVPSWTHPGPLALTETFHIRLTEKKIMGRTWWWRTMGNSSWLTFFCICCFAFQMYLWSGKFIIFQYLCEKYCIKINVISFNDTPQTFICMISKQHQFVMCREVSRTCQKEGARNRTRSANPMYFTFSENPYKIEEILVRFATVVIMSKLIWSSETRGVTQTKNNFHIYLFGRTCVLTVNSNNQSHSMLKKLWKVLSLKMSYYITMN